MKHIIITLIFALGLLGFSGIFPVNAQNMQDGTVNEAPRDVQGQPGAITTGDRDGGVSWWWLLPLLAIPVIYFLARGNQGEDRTVYNDRGLVGAKGGRARRERDEDITDEEELL